MVTPNLPEAGVLIQPPVQYPGSRLTTAGEAWRQVRNNWIIPYGGALFLIWTQAAHGRAATDVTAALAALCLVAAVLANVRGREGWAFLGTAVTLALVVATLFGDLWPNVLPSTTADANSLTVKAAASSAYTLKVMTWVAVLATAGQQVKKGDPLVIMEAMKMEHTIAAPRDGTVAELLYGVGDQVGERPQRRGQRCTQ